MQFRGDRGAGELMGFDELRQTVRSFVDPGTPSEGLQFFAVGGGGQDSELGAAGLHAVGGLERATESCACTAERICSTSWRESSK